MPTIGQLPPATSVSDSDEVAIYQNSQTLSATRGQFLAGTQSSLAVPANSLLGGVGPGTTAPVAITVGANLTLSGTTLSATATPFLISSLATGNPPAAADIVPLGQGGSNVGVSYANFLSSLGTIPNLPGGNLVATASGAKTSRTLAALAANAVSIEDFGAVGDGKTDDSAALLAAVASGNPVRLGAKTYAIVGECDISGSSCVLLGVPGQTILSRTAQSKVGNSPGVTWISMAATTAFVDGIVFDGNTSITTSTFGAMAVQASCTKSRITRCVFKNVMGGSGLFFLASDPTLSSHNIDGCEFTGNGAQGLYSQATDGMNITNCRAHDNPNNGIQVDSSDPSFKLKIRELQIAGNTCWNNSGCGIIVGNFNTTNNSTTVYGNANPDVLGAVVAANNCFNNAEYGIYISGRNILVTGNLCTNNSSISGGGAGILCDTGYCKVSGNMVSGASAFGIDCGGSIYTEVSDNYINGALIGLNIGGGQYCTARANFIQDCTDVAIAVQNVESDGNGNNFNLACTGLSIIGNWINYSGNVVGILIRDAAQNVVVAENVVFANPGASLTSAFSPFTDSIILRDNLLNFSPRWPVNPASVSSVYTLTVPDLVDVVSVTQSTAPIAKMITLQQAQTAGQVTFAKVTNGGSGYTSATATFAGAGSGAAAIVFVSNAGAVIGLQMTSNGSGYTTGTTVTISGNGSGATATVQVGLPVLQNRQLTVDCLTPVTFADAGSSPAQANWTNASITIPTGTSIDWVGNNGGWRAARFIQSDYVSPNGDGSLTVRTQSGDISLHPAGSGLVSPGAANSVSSIGASDYVAIWQNGASAWMPYGQFIGGQTINQLPAAGPAADSDEILVAQGSDALSVQGFSAIWTYLQSKLPSFKPKVVELTSDTVLDATDHNNRILVASTPLTLTANFANMGAGFSCTLINLASGSVAMGTGITSGSGSTSLPPGASATLTAIAYSGGSFVWWDGFVQNAPTITVGSIAAPAPQTAFTVNGGVFNDAPVALDYSTNGGASWVAASTPAISANAYSFTLPGLVAGTYTVQVRDHANTAVVGVSNSFTVLAPTIGLSNVPLSAAANTALSISGTVSPGNAAVRVGASGSNSTPPTSWSNATVSNGNWTASVSAGWVGTIYIWAEQSSATAVQTISAAISVVTPSLTVTAPSNATTAATTAVTGSVSPAGDDVKVQLSTQNATAPTSGWTTATSSKGSFSAGLMAAAAGTYYAWAEDVATGLTAVSNAIIVTAEVAASFTFNNPGGTYPHGTSTIGLNGGVSPAQDVAVQVALSTSGTAAPSSGWESAVLLQNNTFWAIYYPVPATAGAYHVWVETSTGGSQTASTFTLTVT